jgi:hypothetical protein
MTKGQQIVLVVIIVLLFGVTGALALVLLNSQKAAPPALVPTLAIQPASTTAAWPTDTPAPIVAPPTWTLPPTRTSYPTNTPRATHTATSPPTITPTFAPTFTPRPTQEVTSSLPGPTATVGLQNPGFEGVTNEDIPGWSWWAEDNFTPGGDYNPDTSYETPLFKLADDRARIINGPTLQIDAVQHLKFKVHVFQTVPVTPTASVGFQVQAGAYSGSGIIQLAAGIDPDGGPDCNNARWSDIVPLNQEQSVRTIVAPEVTAGHEGKVTVCLYAEPLYAAISNAAFFDDAELIVSSEP